jgi:hypothetical protein
MSTPEDQIVFEDLHGLQEEEPVTVDLDAGRKDAGIELSPNDQLAGADTGDDDSLRIDGLRSADDDADQQNTDQQAASKASEDDEYSKKVQARIKREQRAKAKERQRGDYWENEAKRLAKESYERDKRTFERTVEQADSAITQAQADLKRAIEDGDTDGQVSLTTRLSDLKADKVLAESRLEDLSPDGNVQPFDGKVTPEGEKSTESEAQKWMDDRADWYKQAGFERQTRLANRLDREVFADGYDPNTPEYFEELDRRIKEKAPEVYDDLEAGADDGADDNKEDKRGKNVVTPVGGNETRHQNTSSSKVELDAEDFATMRQFNLDPNDPEVLKEFARNKREAMQGAKR